MPRALLLLLGLRFGSWLRRLKQAVKTKRGAALVIFALVIFAPALAGVVILPFIDRPTEGPRPPWSSSWRSSASTRTSAR